LESKFSKLLQLKRQMLDEKEVRPYCQQILNEKSKWSLSLCELKDNLQLKQILSRETRTESLVQSFHEFFIKAKVENFCKGINIIEQNMNSDINLFALSQTMKNLLLT